MVDDYLPKYVYHGTISKDERVLLAIVGLVVDLTLYITISDIAAHTQLINNIINSTVLRSLTYEVIGDSHQTCVDLAKIIENNKNIKSIYFNMFIPRTSGSRLMKTIIYSNIRHINIFYTSFHTAQQRIHSIFKHNKSLTSYSLADSEQILPAGYGSRYTLESDYDIFDKYTKRNRDRIDDYMKLSIMIAGISRQRTTSPYDIKSHKYILLMIAKCVYSLRYMRDKKYNHPIWRDKKLNLIN